jgi:outer membrane protein
LKKFDKFLGLVWLAPLSVWAQATGAAPAVRLDAPVTVPVPGPSAGPVVHLADAVAAAQAHQPALAAALGQVHAAEARAAQARAPLLPQLSGQSSLQVGFNGAQRGTVQVRDATGKVTGTESNSGFYSSFNVGASASQLLWDFGQAEQRLESAHRLVDVAKLSVKSQQQQVVLNVRRAFFVARAQRALIQVAQETLANQQKHLGQTQAFVEVGTHAPVDLAQAKADVATAQLNLITAQNEYDVARSQLVQAMGGGRAALDFDVADDGLPAVANEGDPVDKLVELAVASRPELAVLERQLAAQESQLRAVEGAYFPTVSAFAAISEGGQLWSGLAPAADVGVQLQWAFFQGGLTDGQASEARANLAVTESNADAERLQVRVDVEQALLNIRAAKASIEASRDAQTNAQARLQLAEGRYQAGTGSTIELGDAQVALTSAAAQAVQADFNLATARAQLLAALGAN